MAWQVLLSCDAGDVVRNSKNSDDDHIGHHDNAYGPGKKSHSGKPENEHDVGFPRREKNFRTGIGKIWPPYLIFVFC